MSSEHPDDIDVRWDDPNYSFYAVDGDVHLRFEDGADSVEVVITSTYADRVFKEFTMAFRHAGEQRELYREGRSDG